MKLIRTFCILLFLLVPAEALGAQIVSAELPAGTYARAGEYLPVMIDIEERDAESEPEIVITAGKLSFSEEVRLLPGSRRRILLNVLVPDENHFLNIRMFEQGRVWTHPNLDRSLNEKLTVVSRTHHIVAILGKAGPQELFRERGIFTVNLGTAIEFPREILSLFDVVAFDGMQWTSFDRSLQLSLEEYIRSGGKLFITRAEEIPEAVARMKWGLGKLILVTSREMLEMRKPEKTQSSKKKLLDRMGLLEPRPRKSLDSMEVAELFEPLPRYGEMRWDWALYSIISFLVILSVSLCGLLRVWGVKTHRFVYFLSLLALTLGFYVAAVPEGNVAFESLAVIKSTSGSELASRHAYVMLYGFADSGRTSFPLGYGGKIYPLRQMWSGSRGERREMGTGPEDLLENEKQARLVNAYIDKGESVYLRVSSDVKYDGAVESRTAEDGFVVFNNVGVDLTNCAFLLSGRISEIGDLPFGSHARIDPGGKLYIRDYTGKNFPDNSRKNRIKATFVDMCIKKLAGPGVKYLIGWSEGPSEPRGYAQGEMLGYFWILTLKD